MEKKIYDLNLECREWQNKLAFYEDDIKIMQGRIEEVNSKNTSTEVRAMIEHFQNQLILQKEQIDIVKKKVKQQINSMEASVEKNPVAADHRSVEDATQLRDEVNTFEKIFNDLRKELISFMAKWM
jgi:chromosome segregation ATPase